METKYLPEIGKQYNDWTVISNEIKKGGINSGSNNRTAYWKVKCKCGREAWRSAYNLVNDCGGRTCKSCARKLTGENVFLKHYLNHVQRRAKYSEFEYDLDIEYVLDLFILQGQKCALSGLDIGFRGEWHKDRNQTASLDRIDNLKGYVKGNVQWLHKDVNNMKHTHDQNYFLELCRKITENERC